MLTAGLHANLRRDYLRLVLAEILVMTIGGFAIASVFDLLWTQTQQFDLALKKLVLTVV
jgi:hypothetical protein